MIGAPLITPRQQVEAQMSTTRSKGTKLGSSTIKSAATDQIIGVFGDLNTSQSKTKILRALYKHSGYGLDPEDERCIH